MRIPAGHRLPALAIAATLHAPAGLALTPGTPADITLHVAGSTIQDNNLVKVLGMICQPGTLDQFRDADPVGKGTYWRAFFCQIDATKVPGLTLTNPRLLILKRNRSGAITGVYPLLETGKGVNFMGIDHRQDGTPQCTQTAAGATWSCRTDRPGDVFPATPDLGVLDTDPQAFRGPNYNPTIDGVRFNLPTPAAIADQLQVMNAGGVLQNTPVTLGLRDALQEAQVAQGRLDPACLTDSERREGIDCMPSLSKSLLASLFAGRIARWSDVQVDVTASGASSPSAKPLTDFNKASLTSDLVHICRRNLGASTQAAVNAYFLNTPCAATGSLPVDISNPVSGPVVVSPPQVTAEEICLADFNDGTNLGTFNPAVNRAWAVGMLTTERNTNLQLNYRYIRIDGAAPTLEEVAAGRYAYFTEAAYVWRKQDPQPTGDTLTLIRKLATEATTPTQFAQLNSTIAHRWGQGSFIATSGQGYTPAAPFNANYPVTAYTHAPDGGLDNCIPPQTRAGHVSNF